MGSKQMCILTYFPAQRGVPGTPVQEVGKSLHIEGLPTPLAFYVRVHSLAPGVSQGHSVCPAAHGSLVSQDRPAARLLCALLG